MPNINVVIDKGWRNVKGKLKGKSMKMHCNSLPTTGDTTWQGTS